MSYAIGQVVRLRVWFTDPENGDARVQPSSVSIKVQDPSGNEQTLTPTLDTADTSYVYDLTVDEAGTWYYRAASTGGYAAAREQAFVVKASQF